MNIQTYMHISQSVLWNVPSQIAAHGNVLIAQTTKVWHGHVFRTYYPSRGRVSSLKYALAHKEPTGRVAGGGV